MQKIAKKLLEEGHIPYLKSSTLHMFNLLCIVVVLLHKLTEHEITIVIISKYWLYINTEDF
jgi:hypothetical protein